MSLGMIVSPLHHLSPAHHPLAMSYTFVHISSDASIPLAELTAAAATLQKDTLKESVSEFFADEEASAAPATRDALHAQRAADVRSSFAAAGQQLTDEYAASAAAARRLVDITLLSVPRAPAFESYSLYSDPDAAAKRHTINQRATLLMHAAGHPPTSLIYGDAFLSKCVDDEAGDVWERRSVVAGDVLPTAAWVRAASAANVGRNVSGWTSAGVMAQMNSGGGGGGGSVSDISSDVGMSAPALLPPPGERPWRTTNSDDLHAYTWRRVAPKEIEVRVPVPEGTRARDVEVVITRTRLGVRLKTSGSVLYPGPIGQSGGGVLTGSIDADECSWAIENNFLTFSLALRDTGKGETSSFAWPRVFTEEL